MSRVMVNAWPGVHGPVDHHRCRRRRTFPSRCRTRVRRLQRLGLQTDRPIPHRRRYSTRTAITTTTHPARRNTTSDGRTDPPATPQTHHPGPRRRRRHDRLAPPTPPPTHHHPHHQPKPALPRHRTTPRRTQTTPKNQTARTLTRVRTVSDVSRHHMERMTGIEPAFSAWEADVLPLNYIREGEPQASATAHRCPPRVAH